MILQKIDNLIKITEDNLLVQMKNYGMSGAVDNWLTKLFSYDITSNFDDLIESLDFAAQLFKIELIHSKDNEEILNRAIHKCKDDNGRCIISVFFDAINQMITLIFDRYIDILIQNNIDISRVSTFEELARLDVRLSRTPRLDILDKSIFDIYNNYVNSIRQDNFNKFFFKLRGSVIDAPFIKEKMNFLDNYIVTIINNKLGKRFSISQR